MVMVSIHTIMSTTPSFQHHQVVGKWKSPGACKFTGETLRSYGYGGSWGCESRVCVSTVPGLICHICHRPAMRDCSRCSRLPNALRQLEEMNWVETVGVADKGQLREVAERRGKSAKRWLREEVAQQRSNSCLIAHLSIHSFVHWFSGSLVCWFPDSSWFVGSLVSGSLIHWSIRSSIRCGSLVHCFSYSLIHWVIASLLHWFIGSLNCWFIVSVIHCFNDLLGHCFIPSVLHGISHVMSLASLPPFAQSPMRFTSATFHSFCISTRRRMARERRGAGASLVSMETQFYKQYMKDVL